MTDTKRYIEAADILEAHNNKLGQAIDAAIDGLRKMSDEIAELKKLRHSLLKEIAKYSSEAGRRAGQMDAARSALLKIWPDGAHCQHEQAREAFAALNEMEAKPCAACSGHGSNAAHDQGAGCPARGKPEGGVK